MIIRIFLGKMKLGLNDTDFLNLIQAGNLGLMDAVDKFDIFKDYNFKTYAEHRITGSTLDELRAIDWLPRSIRKKCKEKDII